MTKQAQYQVTVQRKKRESWLEFKYWWEVHVYMDVEEWDAWSKAVKVKKDESVYDLKGCGYASTIKSAKKKALKHILEVEKEIGKGVTFGVVFNIEKGDAEKVIGELKRG